MRDEPPSVEARGNATIGPISAAGTVVVSLDSEANRVRLSVSDQIAVQDASLRRWMAVRVVWTFIVANAVTLIVIGGLAWLDQHDLSAKLISPPDRIIDRQVILGLLGATTIQLGTIAAIMARYLFPGLPPAAHAAPPRESGE